MYKEAPGIGKTNVASQIIKFLLRAHIPELFVVRSDRAVDIAADRLLEQLRKNDESTVRIYRIKVDTHERIAAKPDV